MLMKLAGLLFVMFMSGCGDNDLPFAPSTAPVISAEPRPGVETADGNWTPWSFTGWQPGIGERLLPAATILATVTAGDLCVERLREVWDRRASCKRFVVSVPAKGRLDAFLRWDTSADGFDASLSGEVVLVAPSGRFAASDWGHTEEHILALVEPGDYGVLVMAYVPASLPFEIRVSFRAD